MSEIKIKFDQLYLAGDFTLPEGAKGLVIFAHGSGSSRFSPRNRYVAQCLKKEGFATLLFDLLTEEEDSIYENRFNIQLITERLVKATNWMVENYDLKNIKIGYFGASTGAAAALKAAAELQHLISAVVSRGGRPDLALESLNLVKAPVLLIVGGNDDEVIELNQQAYDELQYIKKIEIVPGATHLFEEPGKLDAVAQLVINWFKKYLE